MNLPVEYWLQTVLKVANGGKPEAVALQLRRKLEQLLNGRLPKSRFLAHPLPPLSITLRGRRVTLMSDFGPQHRAELETARPEGFSVWVAKRHQDQLEGVIYAAAADPIGRLVRRCDHCGDFFLRKRNHRRGRNFCSDEHRREFDLAHRDPVKQAEYARRWRQTKKKLKARRAGTP